MAREGLADNMVFQHSPQVNKKAHLVAIWEKREPQVQRPWGRGLPSLFGDYGCEREE